MTSHQAIEALYSISGEQIAPSGAQYSAPVTVFASIYEPDPQIPFRRLSFVAYHADSSAFYYETKRSLALIDEWTLEQVLHTDWEKIADKNIDIGSVARYDELPDGEYVPDEQFYQDGLLFFRILINAILYVSSVRAETNEVASPHEGLDEKLKNTKSSLERRDIYRNAQKSSRLPFILVGASVPELQSDDAPAESAFRKNISVRFTVRGHWRKQPYGPGSVERRLQFIQPYFKGPEMADLVNKPYIVRSELLR